MTTETPERWRQIAALFDEAVKLAPERRGEYLVSACGGDADLHRRVVELLETSGQAGDFLGRPVVSRPAKALGRIAEALAPGPAPTPEDPRPDMSDAPGPPTDGADDSTATVPPPPKLPKFIGDYRILRRIGEGGMGVVYEAEQQNPRRPVALKVIRGGHYIDDQAVRLFRREAQALARLKHPGIAAIYESGRTDDGQHFFAMELVRGETLASYVRKRSAAAAGDERVPALASGGRRPLSPPDVRERLALFRKVCDAVSYAHQRGVIHRDLKPSNILVQREAAGSVTGGPGISDTGSQGPAVPDIKILDFGLARITDSDVAMSTIVTEIGSILGTLPYMSPEQVRGNADEIDLRSDVYSLGVILYELLAGRLPLEVQGRALPEAMRVICEEPPQPLTRTFHGTKKLDADLGTIVQKALEKEPARRYQSAAALSEDLRRYLTDQTILARPPSAMYQFHKLVARHKAAFGSIAALFVLLLGFAVTMTVQARRIARERDRVNLERERADREARTATTVADFMMNLFKVNDPWEARGRAITAKELLDAGASKIEKELAGEPLIQAQLMHTMGKVYAQLALPDRAEPLLLKAVDIRRRGLGDNNPEVAHSLIELGAVISGVAGRREEGAALLERALEIQEKNFRPDHPEVAWALYHLGNIYWRVDSARAAAPLERARAIFEKDPSANWRGLSWCLNELGNIKMMSHDYDGANDLLQRALQIKITALGPDDPDVAIALNGVGTSLMRMGRYDEAQPVLERAVALAEQIDPQLPLTGEHLDSLGELLWRRGEPAKAKPILERAIGILEQKNYYQLGGVMKNLACALRDLHEEAASEAMFRRALAWDEKYFRTEDSEVPEILSEYARLLRKTGRTSEAASLERRAATIRQEVATRGSSE